MRRIYAEFKAFGACKLFELCVNFRVHFCKIPMFALNKKRSGYMPERLIFNAIASGCCRQKSSMSTTTIAR